jgi:Ca-activated chloride channel family protein
MTMPSAILAATNGTPVPLIDVRIEATLQDLLAEVSLEQCYRNDETDAIEAVYTFPLPSDGVLLGLEVTLGDRKLEGQVMGRAEAAAGYEDAVGKGDAAVRLEEAQPGLYTLALGNLNPGEQARIRVRYALLCQWNESRLRLALPTTVAPRYGASPLQPHQVPVHSLTVENRFSLRVTVSGALARAKLSCPTHDLVRSELAGAVVFTLEAGKAVMDRDLVLEAVTPTAPADALLVGPDGEGSALIARFQPQFGEAVAERALALALVIDCSGSMEGDSIAQARLAVEGILDRLRPEDSLSIIAFGSEFKRFARRMVPCSEETLARARAFGQMIDADMGGTEIESALEAALEDLGTSGAGQVLLITDGHVGDWEAVTERAERAGHRIFTVGVGSAVSEAFLNEIAERTGGKCERVTPREGMAERIVRQFTRMRAARAHAPIVRWPDGASGITPARVDAIFSGDTLIATARMPQPPAALPASGEVALTASTTDAPIEHVLSLAEAVPLGGLSEDTVARLAAALRLPTLSDTEARETAIRYQLVSKHTDWLMVAERAEAERSDGMPALRVVPQTMAAGWGGMGSVHSRMVMSVADASAPRAFPGYDDSAAYEGLNLELSSSFSMRSTEEPEDRLASRERILFGIASDGRPNQSRLWNQMVEAIESDPLALQPQHVHRLRIHLEQDAESADAIKRCESLAAELGLNVRGIVGVLLVHAVVRVLGDDMASERQAELAHLVEWSTRVHEALARTAFAAEHFFIETAAAREGMQVFGAGWDETLRRLERLRHARELVEQIEKAVDTLIARNEALRREEVGDQFSVTRERIRQIEARAAARRRQPTRAEQLRNFLIDE